MSPSSPSPADASEPAQAASMAPALSRRRAMQLMAASLALSAGGCSDPPRERIYAYAGMPEAGRSGVPTAYASAFLRDGFAQGVLVSTQEGRPTKIEGNPSHPSSLGATDVYAQASVLQLWDPDRAQAVQQRLAAPQRGAAPSNWGAFETAWRERAQALLARGGRGLHVLAGPVTSPTLLAQRARLLQRFPAARWHRHAPGDTDAAARLAYGRPLHTLCRFDRAAFVLTLAADPFSEGPGCVRHAMDWATQRGRGLTDGGAPSLAAVETMPGLFGARADRRLALAPWAIEALLWRVGHALFDDIPAPATPAPPRAQAVFEADLVARLRRHRGDSLLIAGAPLSIESQALALLLNQRLGALGRTLEALDAVDPDAASLAELAQAMDAGEVDTLVVLDANPVYDAPADLEVARALRRVGFSAHLGLYPDETAAQCTWQLPQSHLYEQWSDALAHDGSATLLQPAIAPLYASRSAHELLALMTDDPLQHGHDMVRRQWQTALRGGQDFEAWWQASLRAGVVADSAPRALALPPAPMPAPPDLRPPPASALQPVFVADASVGDGRFANNAWLQELPRPYTKLTWDNAIHLGPTTAQALHLRSGDVVRARRGERELEAPVWVLDGHAEGAATLPLGYGRRAAGRVGNGVGFDAYRLRTRDRLQSLQLTPTGRRHAYARTQHHLDQEGRELARRLRPGEAIEHPDLHHPTLYPERAYPQHAWAMVIDLDACIGCNACTIACQAENNIPVVGPEEVARGREMHWIRVDRYADDAGRSIFQPVPCMHCENAPCELVCPVGATVHDSEGLNVQVYNRCIGTRFCSNNCPYKVRRFNFLQYADRHTPQLALQRNPQVTVRQRGVMEKCTYCLQRLSGARLMEEQTGRALEDGEVVTACQAVCPTRAIHFGDLNDPKSDVRRQKASPRHYAMLGELNTQPRTTYLAKVEEVRGPGVDDVGWGERREPQRSNATQAPALGFAALTANRRKADGNE